MIYLIQADAPVGPVKIGLTRNIQSRMAKMQTDTHSRLTLLRLLHGDRETERLLHERFSDLRVRAEWFAYSGDMLGDLGAPDFAPEPVPAVVITDLPSLIEAAGGVSRMGATLGVSHATICDWQRTGFLPSNRIAQIAGVFALPVDLVVSMTKQAAA